MARNHPGSNGQPRIVASYDYTDETGAPLFRVDRYEPGFDGECKTFRQRRPDGKGGWVKGLGDVRRVLYRLHELAADTAGRPVFQCEGEKDADKLAGQGLLATTNPMGAGKAKWRPEYSESLRGRHVIILADNDEVGREHAKAVANALAGIAASVAILELPNLPPKGDVSDWLAAGGTKDMLLKLSLECPKWEKQGRRPGSNRRAKAAPPAGSAGDRPPITITVDEHIVNAQAVAALAGDDTVYQRGGTLVHVVRDASPAAKGIRRPFAPRIETLPPPLLRERLAANAQWMTVQETQHGEVEKPARPPAWCVAAVHARANWPGIRHLEAVVDYPVLRPDGTYLEPPRL